MSGVARVAVGMLVSVVLASTPATAGQPAAGVDGREFRGVCLRQAVTDLFAGRPEQAVVLPDVAAYPVNVAFQPISLPGAVDVIARSARVEVRREGGVYTFGRGERSPAPESVAEIVRNGDRLAVRVTNFPLTRAAVLIGAHIPSPIDVAEPLAEARVTLTWEGPRDRSAAEALARSVDAGLVATNDRLRLEPAPERLVAEGTKDRVTLDLRRAPLRAAATAVARILGVELVVRAGVPEASVTLSVRDVPAETALRLLARWADAASEEGVVLQLAGAVATLVPPARVARATLRVSLDLNDIPLRHALRLLFHGSGVPFAVQPEVPDVPITLSVENMELISALRAVTGLAASRHPGITFWKQNDVYTVGIRRN